MSIFSSFDINASGMTAERLRLDVISQNIANSSTTRTEDGTPYRRKVVTFEEKKSTAFSNILSNAHSQYTGSGVKVSSISEDTTSDFVKKYDPSHPDADEDGYVSYPNVNTVTEMTNMIDASRAYEANVTAFNTSKSIALKGLEIGK
ncbi:flagellar basal body rod protein FlgC [Konateibacter massiliensis]|uniref:flagellar basal body rod protein FlgC n=1 Tax=Konateibacter massiliensis TaxID=2002841 RepID=UPI000C14AD2F|nr:flagellar basal body rod protein FlgC [Konateibacter massiliensis]